MQYVVNRLKQPMYCLLPSNLATYTQTVCVKPQPLKLKHFQLGQTPLPQFTPPTATLHLFAATGDFSMTVCEIAI